MGKYQWIYSWPDSPQGKTEKDQHENLPRLLCGFSIQGLGGRSRRVGADSRRRKSVTISTSPPRALRTNNPYLDHMYYAKIMDKGVCNSKDTTRCASVSRVLWWGSSLGAKNSGWQQEWRYTTLCNVKPTRQKLLADCKFIPGSCMSTQ